jgi:hypothetical protein
VAAATGAAALVAADAGAAITLAVAVENAAGGAGADLRLTTGAAAADIAAADQETNRKIKPYIFFLLN